MTKTGREVLALLECRKPAAWCQALERRCNGNLNGDAMETVRFLKLVPSRREKTAGIHQRAQGQSIFIRKPFLQEGLWMKIGLRSMHGY